MLALEPKRARSRSPSPPRRSKRIVHQEPELPQPPQETPTARGSNSARKIPPPPPALPIRAPSVPLSPSDSIVPPSPAASSMPSPPPKTPQRKTTQNKKSTKKKSSASSLSAVPFGAPQKPRLTLAPHSSDSDRVGLLDMDEEASDKEAKEGK